MMGAVHLLPGTTFSDVKRKGSYPSEARAVLTLSELERWLALPVSINFRCIRPWAQVLSLHGRKQ
jgi:hypothetical protein